MSHSPFPYYIDPHVPTAVFDANGWKFAATTPGQMFPEIDPETAADNAALIAAMPAMIEALERLTNAKALCGVRQVVAGWNGEGRPDPFQHRHPDELGATLPKTTCGAVYDLDDALQSARAVLASIGKTP